jgi:hypothetical protein
MYVCIFYLPVFSPACGLSVVSPLPPGLAIIGLGQKVLVRCPLVEVPVDGMFSKESSTRLSGKHLLFEPYLYH